MSKNGYLIQRIADGLILTLSSFHVWEDSFFAIQANDNMRFERDNALGAVALHFIPLEEITAHQPLRTRKDAKGVVRRLTAKKWNALYPPNTFRVIEVEPITRYIEVQ